MAVAIPLIAGYVAGAAGASAVVATAVSIGAGLVAQKTGISAKVDRAAGKVFGEDAVKAFNIAGAVYGAFGGFAGQGPGQVWDNIGGAFGGSAAVAPTGGGSEITGVGIDATGGMETAVDSFGYAPGAETVGAMGGDYSGAQYQAPSWANPTPAPAAPGAQPGAQPTAAPAAPTTVQPAAKPGTASASIEKLWDSLGPQGKAMVIQTGGQVLSGAAAGKAQQAQLDAEAEERRRRGEPTGMRWGRPSASSLAAFNDFYAGKR